MDNRVDGKMNFSCKQREEEVDPVLYRTQSHRRRFARHAARDGPSSLSPNPIVPTFCSRQMFDDNDTINFVPEDRNIKHIIYSQCVAKHNSSLNKTLFCDSYRTMGFRSLQVFNPGTWIIYVSLKHGTEFSY